MSQPRVTVDQVWKKFYRGERHDTIRDMVAGLASPARFRRQKLADQEFWALRNVSFDVRPGETVGIIGRNGAGKSTMLKLLTRILRPTAGHCAVRGRVGALIELAAGFHPDLTGRENIYLQGAIMGMRRAEIAQRFDEIVDFSGIGAFIDTQVKRYSSGMNARLGFSIAAFLQPDVLLIDEVLAVGDLSFQQKCYGRLAHFKRQGVATAFVSHSMQAIATLCDRVVYLRPNAEPMVGSVSDAVSAYLSGDSGGSDHRIRVLQSRIVHECSGAVIHEAVEPGARLRVEVEVEALADLPDCGFGISVTRSDGLMIFHGNSLVDGVDVISVSKGEVLSCSTSLRANLGSGVYTVTVSLGHSERLWGTVECGVVGSFVVDNARRWETIAELEPVFQLAIAPSTNVSTAPPEGQAHEADQPSQR